MAQSLMAKEALQTPEQIRRQLHENQDRVKNVVEAVKAFAPKMVYLIGRGSSDHSGVYAKYLIETELGIPVCAAAPSVSTLFGKALQLQHALVICISQSGRSPDILHQVTQAKQVGAMCLALVNDESSPLADLVDHVIPLKAGPEKAVAATKSFLCTLSAIASLVAVWSDSQPLWDGLQALPKQLESVVGQESQLKLGDLKDLRHCVVLGRGFGYAISRELALKLKEVCSIHAEAFSSAEFLHGPITLVAKKLTLVNIEIEDETFEHHKKQVDEVIRRGGKVLSLQYVRLDMPQEQIHQRLIPLAIMLRFYLDIESIAQQMGLNPDEPTGLNKVTQTL
ncbi:glucosamine-6-phosphate deaminase NagB-II [Paraglaciecola sp. 2405UD69-4]|uniref:glucosamine-6-phosphate deaminase NagB-II n=1 Tax=Paraglaciecola sp. 2405UD69-4 TaxID=3391836 RepID=UPI0039C9311B